EDEDILMETAIDAGADDFIVDNDGSFEVIVDPSKYEVFCSAMTEKGFSPIQREITMRCSTIANLDEGNAATMIKLTGALEDLDDVQAVFSNADISDEILAKI
ncbi:MAG: YebC/PmpR family DNA-binding transcriptional regulator, partial [Woeseiaceae bacterium]|nr:YebC/PmpR family DNA-binding transcriptional regulator [Woeseiaceae bacterium]